jgi:5-methylthioadenosine/S-adenosylhomocysteine deaminase
VNPVGRVLTREDVRIGARLRAAEMLLGGVTCVSDMSCHRNPGSLASLGSADGLAELGIRGVVAFGAEDDYPQAPAADVFIAEQEALCDRLSREELLGFRAGVGTILGATDELMQRTVIACQQHGWSVHTHLAEVREEITAARARYRGRTTIEQAAALGLLDHDVLAGHCIWCSTRDISLLAAHDVAVAHNPVANMILASGVCPVAALRREGITVALGTDGAASNDNQDMLAVLKTAALLHKLDALRADAITAREVVRMATIDGARALGLDSQIGSLEPGKRADVLLLDGNTPELAAIHDPWQQVVYCATGRCVSSVWVDGRELVSDGELVDVDVRALAREARSQARELAVRAGLVGESVYVQAREPVVMIASEPEVE